MASNLEETLEIFAQFYEQLYTSVCPSQVDINGFLDGLSILRLSDEHCQTMDSPITVVEVEITIDGLKNNKAPGLDGLKAKFYKKFKNTLALKFCNLNDCLIHRRIPPSC